MKISLEFVVVAVECEGHVCVGTVVKKVGGCVGEFWNLRKWLW